MCVLSKQSSNLKNLNLSLGLEDELEGIRPLLEEPKPAVFPHAKKVPTMTYEKVAEKVRKGCGVCVVSC